MKRQSCFPVFVVLFVPTLFLFVGGLLAQKPAPTVTPSPTPISPASTGVRVRTDGLYYADVGGDPKAPAFKYFRFFDDGTGIVNTAVTKGTPVQVAKWFVKDSQYAMEGAYRLEDNMLIFVVGDEHGAHTKYAGPLTAGYWVLNPDSPKPIKFFFARVVFPKAVVRAGQNRAPKIAPVISTTDTFAYDSAGRTVGVITTIEIKAADADGDTLSYSWAADSGTISGNGAKCDWRRPIVAGQASGGTVVVTVTDGRGGKTSREFRF